MTRLALGVLLPLLLLASPAAARPGDLDRSFGDKAGFSELDSQSDETSGNAVAVRPDGRIVAVGSTRVAGGTTSFGEDHFVIALFGRRGTRPAVRTVGFGAQGPFATAVGVALFEGRILVAGEARTLRGEVRAAVARLTASGRPDRSYGVDGRVLGPLVDDVTDMAVDSRGRVLVAGSLRRRLFVARFTADGELDGSFGVQGVSADSVLRPPRSLAVDRADRIVVAAVDGDGRTIALTRLKTDGTRDTRFADDGIARRKVGSQRGARVGEVIALPGRAGYAVGASARRRSRNEFVVVRFTAGGAVPRFGRGGVARIPIGYGEVNALVRQPGGRLIVGGAGGGAALARFLPSGRIDRRFGRRGLRVVSLGEHDGSAINGLALQGKRLIGVGTDSLDERIDYASYLLVARFRL